MGYRSRQSSWHSFLRYRLSGVLVGIVCPIMRAKGPSQCESLGGRPSSEFTPLPAPQTAFSMARVDELARMTITTENQPRPRMQPWPHDDHASMAERAKDSSEHRYHHDRGRLGGRREPVPAGRHANRHRSRTECRAVRRMRNCRKPISMRHVDSYRGICRPCDTLS